MYNPLNSLYQTVCRGFRSFLPFDRQLQLKETWKKAIENYELEEITALFQSDPLLPIPVDLINLTIPNKERDGESLLHLVAFSDNLFLLDILIKNGADLDLQDSIGKTPLMIGRLRAVQCLIANGTNVHLQDSHGRTALFIVTCKGAFKIAKELIMAGANVNLKDRAGCSPLHIKLSDLSAIGSIDTVRNMLAMGVDPNLQDKGGRTALHLIAQRPLGENYNSDYLFAMIATLLAGANPKILDNQGRSVIDTLKEGLNERNQSFIEILARWEDADTSILQQTSLEALLIKKILLESKIFVNDNVQEVEYQGQSIGRLLPDTILFKIRSLLEIIVGNSDNPTYFFVPATSF